jgi:FkbM family methyltransferase
MRIAEALVGLIRPLDIPGVNRVLGGYLPREGKREVPVAGDVRFLADMANEQQRQMFVGCFAREVSHWIRRILRTGDTFVDVGANVGYVTLLGAARVGRGGRVVAVEPYPPNFRILTEQVERNRLGYVKLMPVALSDEPGSLRLYAPPAEEHRDYNVSYVKSENYQAVDVPTRKLDDVLDELGIETVRLMKVDVEGAEPKVFAGGERSLGAGRVQHVISEINGPYLVKVGSSPRKVCEQMKGMGFEFAKVGSRGVEVGDEPGELKDLGDEANFDAVFVHESAVVK